MHDDFPGWLRQALANNRNRPAGDLIKRGVPNPYTGEVLTLAMVAEALGVEEDAVDTVRVSAGGALLPVREFRMSRGGELVLRDYREDADLHNLPYYRLIDLTVGGTLADQWNRLEWFVVAEGPESIQHFVYEAEYYCGKHEHLSFNAADLGADKPGWQMEYRDVDAAEQDRERRLWVQAEAQAETRQREAEKAAATHREWLLRKAVELNRAGGGPGADFSDLTDGELEAILRGEKWGRDEHTSKAWLKATRIAQLKQ